MTVKISLALCVIFLSICAAEGMSLQSIMGILTTAANIVYKFIMEYLQDDTGYPHGLDLLGLLSNTNDRDQVRLPPEMMQPPNGRPPAGMQPPPGMQQPQDMSKSMGQQGMPPNMMGFRPPMPPPYGEQPGYMPQYPQQSYYQNNYPIPGYPMPMGYNKIK
ncbi:unnamed protein product [Phyllotreta striolata]|uniref:Uncharacterized protein n=1 Tax=Phyllotreta striolata TaxID=444603 RepID=A0A9N9TYY7_PHYSR|nr:unnamed protein product [Phyllotreta striolata]